MFYYVCRQYHGETNTGSSKVRSNYINGTNDPRCA